MRIVTWNMGYTFRKNSNDKAWEYLTDVLNPDIALVQEAHPPNTPLDDHLILHDIKEKGEWGSGIYSRKHRIDEIEFKDTYPGALVGAYTPLPNGDKITLVSLYGQLEYKYGSKVGYATPSVQKMISELTWLFMGEGNFKDYYKNIIVGGDFNIGVQWDMQQHKKNKSVYRDAHRIVFERLDDFGLQSVYDWSGKEGFVQTHRHRQSAEPWQDDYIFLTKRLFSKVISRSVVDSEEVHTYSDHNPVVMELDLG